MRCKRSLLLPRKYCNLRFWLLVCLMTMGFTCITLFHMDVRNDELAFILDSPYLSAYIRPDAESCLICAPFFQMQCQSMLDHEAGGSGIVYFVTTSPDHRQQRHAIRSTWAKVANPRPVFIVGNNSDHVDMALVMNEAKIYQDIIVEDYYDTYWNLSLKTGFILKNFLRFCPNAKYLVKTDDDMFINPMIMETILANGTGDDMIGFVMAGTKPHRNPQSKYYLPQWMYNQSYLPDYLSGTTYVLPGRRIPEIYERALRTPLIHLEDVFMSVVAQALNITLVNDIRFSSTRPVIDDPCLFKELAAVHRFSAQDLGNYWPVVFDLSDEDCRSSYVHKLGSFMHTYVFKGF